MFPQVHTLSFRTHSMQETVYQSLQRNSQLDVPRASSSANSNSRANQCHGPSREEGNSSEILDVESQLASDEALARELQEVENQFAGASLSEAAGAETGKYDDTKHNQNLIEVCIVVLV